MANEGLTARDLRNTILFGALVFLAIKFVPYVVSLIIILGVSIILTIVLDPIVSSLQKRKIPRQVSAACLALLVIALVALTLFLVIPPASRQVIELGKQLPDMARTATHWLQTRLGPESTLGRYLPQDIKIDVATVRPLFGQILGGASIITAGAAQAVVSGFLVFVITIHLLSGYSKLVDGILRGLSADNQKKAMATGSKTCRQLRAWANGILIDMSFMFVVTWLLLAAIGIKQAFLFGIIVGLFAVVPVIGPILSAAPPVIVALLSDPIKALYVVLVFLGIQQVEGNVLMPLIMSRQLALHPVTVIISVVVMGGLFGIVGIALATPAVVVAGAVYEEFYLNSSNKSVVTVQPTKKPRRAKEEEA
jgi:putative permease